MSKKPRFIVAAAIVVGVVGGSAGAAVALVDVPVTTAPPAPTAAPTSAGQSAIVALDRPRVAGDRLSSPVSTAIRGLGFVEAQARLIASGRLPSGLARQVFLVPKETGELCFIITDENASGNIPVACAADATELFGGGLIAYQTHWEGQPDQPRDLELAGFARSDSSIVAVRVDFLDGTSASSAVNDDGGFLISGSAMPARLVGLDAAGSLVQSIAYPR